MDSRDIIRRMYPEVLRPSRWYRRLGRRIRTISGGLIRRFNRWAKKHAWHLTLGAIACGLWAFIHITYYNRIVALEFNVQTAWAQVESEQKRRHNIQQSIVRAVIAYAHHEQSLMTELTKLRTEAQKAASRRAGEPDAEKPPTPPELPAADALDKLSPEQLERLFPNIMVVAEQYPNLRLTENYQQLTAAVIETETRIATRVQSYNDAVNMYTTMLRTFPGMLFAKVWGFEMYDFYEPDAKDTELVPMRFEPPPSPE